jgi:alpha-methylacyl-CoA racemase
MADNKGPLAGVRIIEMAGIGPAPFGATMLADAGADVVRIEGPARAALTGAAKAGQDPMTRGRRCLSLDLKLAAGVEALLQLIDGADALVEGYRPGVMERLGLGPDVCLARKPALVYGRMTGWGQSGPLSHTAGHDINYIAISGALHGIGTPEQPVVPLNLVGDFGGGGALLAFGVSSALLAAARTGRGQVIDVAMSDGAALLMAPFYAKFANGAWQDERGSNLLDGAAPHYGTYRCSDGKFIAIGPLEPQFYDRFLALLGLADDALFRQRDDCAQWPPLRARLEKIFAASTRDEWCGLLEGTDACFSPVLSLAEAPKHPHNAARRTFVDTDGAPVPAPAPRFSGSDNRPPPAQRNDAATADDVMRSAGFSNADIARLRRDGVLNN